MLTLPVIFLVVTPLVVIAMRRINAQKPAQASETDSRARAHRLLARAELEALLEDAAEQHKASLARLRSAAENLEAAAERRRKDSLAKLCQEMVDNNRAMGVNPDSDW